MSKSIMRETIDQTAQHWTAEWDGDEKDVYDLMRKSLTELVHEAVRRTTCLLVEAKSTHVDMGSNHGHRLDRSYEARQIEIVVWPKGRYQEGVGKPSAFEAFTAEVVKAVLGDL